MGDFTVLPKIRIWALLAFAAFLFFGQSCQFHDEMQPITTSVEVTQSVDHAFDDMSFVSASWIRESWWEMFQDPQLSSMIEMALQNSPDLQMAVERVSMARDCAKNAFAPMLPQIEATFEEFFAGFTWNQRGVDQDALFFPDRIVPSWINFLTTLLQFRWRIDLWGTQKKLYKAAIDEAKMQMAECAYAKLMISVQLATSYFNYQHSLSKREILSDILKTQNQVLDIQEQIYVNGLSNEIRLQSLERDILETQNQLLNIENDLSLSENQLRMLMGYSADEGVDFQVPTASFGSSFPFPTCVSTNLLLKRPDVVAKIWGVLACQKRVSSAKTSFLPTIDLGSLSGYLNLNWDTLIKPRGWFSSVAPMASLPLFQGLKLRTNLSLSVRRYNYAVQEYNQVLLKAAKEVVDAICTFKITNDQLNQQLEIISKSENIEELNELRYEAGLNPLIDVLKTRMNVYQDELGLLQMQKMHLLAALNLIKSIGGGYDNFEATSQLGDIEDS